MRDRPQLLHRLFKEELLVHRQFLLRQQHRPEHRLRNQRLLGAPRHIRRLKGAAIREVALEVRRVDFDLANLARLRQRNDRPVVARLTTPPRLPPIPHVHTTARHQQARRQPKVLVVRRHHVTAVLHRNQVDQLVTRTPRPIALRQAIQAQSRQTAVGVQVHTHMGRRTRVDDRVVVMRVAL
ncbi:hypothetical protein PCO31111_05131 [Pandoraea communis]|uniref:Uncharacterized protein n=1 Tax=Pandoraea communis TaxID=2508297 RepID=A0A5E4Z7C4_9BURK|nr:hypothetical protein PCO31111_05131 [Pandoraea communis]